MDFIDKIPHAVLSLHVNGDEELYQKYVKHVKAHNNKIVTSTFPDSGFDLFIPNETTFDLNFKTQMIDLNIICEMHEYDLNTDSYRNSAYYVYPRSSLSKTPLMLSNHTGIIDSGYRGNIKAAFRYLPFSDATSFSTEKHQRLLQICHPSLCKVYVKLVDFSTLSTTERGQGGFGSTGI